MPEIGLVIVDPGHFHVALVQQEMHPNVSSRAHVYAPLGPDLIDYLTRIARFNNRPERSTRWDLEVHASHDFLDRMNRERPGSIAIFSGRNRGKIDRVRTAIEAGLHVLADKPLIIRREDLPALEGVLAMAQQRRLILGDMMGGRHDIVAKLAGLLRADPEVFGETLPGSADEPGAAMTGTHHIFKEVAGVPNFRPAWYFDIDEQGEGIADVGTHMVDRVHRTLFAEEAVDHRTDIRLHSAHRWPTMLSRAQFCQVTGEPQWPDYLERCVEGDALEYFCNTRLHYEVRGIHVTLETRWEWQAPAGGDTSHSRYRGSRAVLEIRQGATENWRPELYIVAVADIGAALERRVALLQDAHPGIGLEQRNGEFRATIPEALRLGHDAQFIQLTRQFLHYVDHPSLFPPSERANMLSKYYVCTEGVALSRGDNRSARPDRLSAARSF
jgi:predicted dehydrogenase